MSFYRMRPPLNKQDDDNTCWAAVLDSFSRVTGNVPNLNESDLVSRFGDGSQKGGLTPWRLFALTIYLRVYGLQVDLIDPYLPFKYEVEDRLRKSHVILMYNIKDADWHAWLVYGVDNWLCFMDPRTGEYSKMRLELFASTPGYYAIWRP